MYPVLLILLVLLAFAFMEFVAWFTHKYVMHGFLWLLHKDHHSPKRKRLERNDFFAVIFAIPSFLLIYLGALNSNEIMKCIGFGIALYGLSYFLFHDIYYHRRIKLFNKKGNWYLQAIVKAHEDHHKGKKNYGFLFMVPVKYIRDEYHKYYDRKRTKTGYKN